MVAGVAISSATDVGRHGWRRMKAAPAPKPKDAGDDDEGVFLFHYQHAAGGRDEMMRR